MVENSDAKWTYQQTGKAVEKYMFAMFNENQKPEGMEQYFVLFEPDMTAVYRVDFAGSYWDQRSVTV